MRRSPVRCRLPLALAALLVVPACSGGSSTSSTVNHSISPCNGVTTPTVEGTTPTIVPVFDVWEASFAPPTPRPTATSAPTSSTPGAPTPVEVGTATPAPTPQPNNLKVSVDTADQSSASRFRLTVACQGTVVIPATICGLSCSFPPPPDDAPCADDENCPLDSIDLNQFGFGDLRRVGCLIELGPTEPLGLGMCTNPNQANYQLNVTLNGDAPLTLTLDAHNCRATESCLQEVFGIDVGN